MPDHPRGDYQGKPLDDRPVRWYCDSGHPNLLERIRCLEAAVAQAKVYLRAFVPNPTPRDEERIRSAYQQIDRIAAGEAKVSPRK